MEHIEYTNHEILEDLADDTVCSICYAEFLDLEDLNLHIIQYHVSETNKNRYCKFCSRIFPDQDSFAIHIVQEHLSSVKSCKYCKRLFSYENQLLEHEKKHKSKKLFPRIKCSVCELIFIDKKDLEEHEFQHDSGDGVMLLPCYPALSVVLHMNARSFFEVSHKNLLYKCHCCNLSTPNLDIHLDHVKTSNCKTICCDTCFDVFRLKNGLRNHLTKHEVQAKKVPSNKDVKCNQCDLYFASPKELVNHVSTHSVTNTMSVQTCQYCRRPLVGQSALLKHIERTHKYDKHLYKYNCIYCNIKFKHPKLLFGHFFTQHKDIEPYTCVICDTKFRIRKKFTLHIKLEHKGIGFVEFDDNFHVYFTDKKSVKNSMLNESNDSQFSAESSKNDNEENNQSIIRTPVGKNVNLTKIRIKIEQENVNSDVNKTDSDKDLLVERIMPVKQKKVGKTRKRRQRVSSSSDSDVPLAKVMKKTKMKSRAKIKKFVCTKCNQNCYTFHFFNQHMATHNRSEKSCIKCNEKFSSTQKLKDHVASKHVSSELTDTLKKFIEKRKEKIHEIYISKQFLNTMKKVPSERTETSAKIRQVNDKLSAKNFLETFTPEVNDVKVVDVANVTVEPVQDKPRNLIRMTKFTPDPPCTNRIGLKMPEKFKPEPVPTHLVSIKLITLEPDSNPSYSFNELGIEDSHVDDDYEDIQERAIPEVGREIMLEETEPDKVKYIKKTIIIKNVDQNDIRIAHLAPEAPYFKIVSMDKVIAPKEEEPPKDVTLPNGTKLVSVNPLAHLLDKNSIKDICKSLNKSRPNPKVPKKDFSKAIVKAMSALERPVKRVKKMKDGN